ncbi:MAG: thioredoxin-disulfide reductase [Tissierellia bacterium]|nr:thioredoxin-disulfide reductase [Tissierellia bacterium]
MLYDTIIIGSGPAGLAAGLYAARGKLKTLILEKEMDGGQIVGTAEVENYPGTKAGSSGLDIINTMVEQVKHFGAEKKQEGVIEVDLKSQPKKVKTEEGEYEAKTVIIATGALPRNTGAVNEDKFIGRGISFCATCDAAFYEDLHVYVIGGGDSAVEEAIYLTKYARKVTIVHRRDELRAAKSIQEKAFNNPKIDFIWDSQVKEFVGDMMVEKMILTNLKTGEDTEIVPNEDDGIFGVFEFVGYSPNTKIFEGQVAMEKGYIVAGEDTKTDVDGVFVAGDVRTKDVRQVVTAVSDGAVAALKAEKYIDEL